MKKTIQSLVKEITNAVQEEAKKVPGFDNGAIRILFSPKCSAANSFLGEFTPKCELDFGYPIKPGGSHTRPADENQDECDCYGYAALKIGGCVYALKNNLGRRSSDMPNEAETWGRTNDRGCIVYDIYYTSRFGPADDDPIPDHYLRLYVAVSGASGEEDERCALAAGNILQEWCNIELEDDGFGHKDKCLSLIGPEL